MSTNIEDLVNNTNYEVKNVTDDELYQSIFNFDIEENLRLEYIDRYNIIYPNKISDLLNQMKSMFLLSHTKLIHQFLLSICKNSNIEHFLKLECCISLCKNKFDIRNFECLEFLLSQDNDIVPICEKNAILLLITCEDLRENALKHIVKYINKDSINIKLRYELILDICKNVNKDLDNYYTINSSNQFIKNDRNKILYKLLCCQNLLINYDIDNKDDIESILLEFANNTQLSHELRSDSADILLNCGSDCKKEVARSIIMQLGLMNSSKVQSIYDNTENIHFKDIEKSSIEIIEKIYDLDINIKFSFKNIFEKILQNIEKEFSNLFVKKLHVEISTFSYIETILNNTNTEFKTKYDLITVSLNRINLDRAIYSKFNLSLSKILELVYNYIIQNENSDEMYKRLEEELVEMSGKCSSGYAFRLVNVLSGFGEFSIKISHFDRLKSMFIHNINNYIKESNISDILLEELAIKPIERKEFPKFLSISTQKISRNLYDDFKDDLSYDDYIFYIRQISMEYEGY